MTVCHPTTTEESKNPDTLLHDGCGCPRITRTVSRAISNSSFVGIAYASSRESSVLIVPSQPTIRWLRVASINLTRDDLTHNIDVMTTAIYQSDQHAQRYTKGLFTDEVWASLNMPKIKIGREQLTIAIDLGASFCRWLEGIRLHYLAHLKSLAASDAEGKPKT